MSIRLQANEDLDSDIIAALRRREPAIDILDIKKAGMRGAQDPASLDWNSRRGFVEIQWAR